jgi:hypothetical protein
VSPSKIIRGTNIHCIELNSNEGRPGSFYMDEREISAHIYDYNQAFSLRDVGPIFLRTEDNDIVSLYSNIIEGPSHNSRLMEPRMSTYKIHVISNSAIIGPNRWLESDRIRRVHFAIDGIEWGLFHTKKLRKLARPRVAESDWLLLSQQVSNFTIRIIYTRPEKFGHGSPRIELEFDCGVPFGDLMGLVDQVVRFFVFSTGLYLRPKELKISRLTLSEFLSGIESDHYFEDHSVEFKWEDIEANDWDSKIGRSVFYAMNDRELAVLKESLVKWVQMDTEWKNASSMMRESATLRGHINPDRLLYATKWMEETPTAKTVTSISDTHIEIIAQQAAKFATSLGYKNLESRITGSLRNIKSETRNEFFTRLITKLRAKGFPSSLFDGELVANLTSAMNYRGRIAHSHFYPKSDAEWLKFANALAAVEMFCFLLLAAELPLHKRNLDRIESHPFVHGYIRRRR